MEVLVCRGMLMKFESEQWVCSGACTAECLRSAVR